MKLFEQIDRINAMININEDIESKNARLVDILIKSTIGDIKMVKFKYNSEGEYFWIKNYDDSIDYSDIGYDDYLTEYGEDTVVFSKNSWGKLWVHDCTFIKAYIDNFVTDRDEDESEFLGQKHYQMIIDYIMEKYNVNIKAVNAEDCDDDFFW